MTNLVQVTVRANDDSSWSAIKAQAARAGAAAADAFNEAFRLKADASVTTKDKLTSTGGLGGSDTSLMSKLKSYANTPGGIGILGTGSDTSLMSMLKNQIRSMGSTGGPGLISGMGAGGTTSDDLVRQVMTGNGPSNVTTDDFIKQIMTGIQPGNITTEDFIKQVVEGNTPGNISTTDTIHERVDTSQVSGRKDGGKYGSDFLSGFSAMMRGSGGDGGGGMGGALSDALNSGGVAGGALPGIPGISGFAATITGLAAALVAVLPAITSVLGGLTAIGGGFAILETTNAKFAADMSSTFSGLEKVFAAAAEPLAKPLEDAASQILSYFQQIGPLIGQVFGDSAKLIQPLVYGFEGLVGNLLPGFTTMIKDAGPAFSTLSGAFADLGKSLGEMFADFGAASGPSAQVLKAILDLVNTLFPVLGKLGEVFATALAPAVTAFAGAIDQVLPALQPLFSILAQLAGAVLSDLASVLGSVGSVLTDLAPSFTILGKVASNLFNTLENTGVFAILGDALESLAKPMANLINTIAEKLAPVLPPLIDAFAKIAGTITTGLVTIVGNLANALTQMIAGISPADLNTLVSAVVKLAESVTTALVNSIVQIADAFIKAFAQNGNQIGQAMGSVAVALANIAVAVTPQLAQSIADIGVALADIVAKVSPTTFQLIADSINGIATAVTLVGHAMTGEDTAIKDAVSDIRKVWGDAGTFLSSVFGGIESDAKSHFDNLKNTVTGDASDVYNGVYTAFHDLETMASGVWSSVYGTVKSDWATVVSFFGGIPGRIATAVSSLPGDMTSAGRNAISGLYNGITSALSNVGNWVNANIVQPVISAVKHFFGINSPSTVMAEIGGHLVGGMIKGLVDSGAGLNSVVGKVFGSMPQALLHMLEKGSIGAANLPGKAISALKGLGSDALGVLSSLGGEAAGLWDALFGGGSGGGGVQQWSGDVLEALKMLGLPAGDLGTVLSQMSTESGGNASAINLSDINAQQGDPSRGLMQVIGTTFAAYRSPSLPDDIYNPLANIYAGLNYAVHRYGADWTSVLGHGHGYAAGGATSAGWSVLGEMGRELVKLPGGASVMPHGATEAALSGLGGPLCISLELGPSFQQLGLTAQQLKDIRYTVRTKGGGSVQAAFGQH